MAVLTGNLIRQLASGYDTSPYCEMCCSVFTQIIRMAIRWECNYYSLVLKTRKYSFYGTYQVSISRD